MVELIYRGNVPVNECTAPIYQYVHNTVLQCPGLQGSGKKKCQYLAIVSIFTQQTLSDGTLYVDIKLFAGNQQMSPFELFGMASADWGDVY